MRVTFAGRPDVRLSTGHPSAGDAATEPGAPVEQVDPVAFVDALPAGDHVVLAWGPGIQGGLHGLRVARALSMRTDLAVVEVHGLPTQAAALWLVAQSWPQELPPVALAELAVHLRSTSRTVAVIASVSRLSEPAPSVLQHALSLLPWTRFTVDYDFDRVTAGGQPPRRAHGLLGPVVLAVGDPGGHALAEPLLDWAGPVAATVVAPAEERPAARRWAEVTVLPDSPLRTITRFARTVVVDRCAGCERPVTGRVCLFCGHAQAPAASEPPSEPPREPAPEPAPEPAHEERGDRLSDLDTILLEDVP